MKAALSLLGAIGVSIAPVAHAQTVVNTLYATSFSDGRSQIMFQSEEKPVPSVAVGDAIDVSDQDRKMSGTVVSIQHAFNRTVRGNVENRNYATYVLLKP